MRGQREDVVAGVLADLVRDEAPVGRVLAIDDRPGTVEAAFRERGDHVERWRRRAVAGGPEARPWPPDGPFDCVSLRLPKGRETLRCHLHAALSRLHPGAPLWLYGANDEGVRSAGKTLETIASDVRSLESKRHCRIWRAERRSGDDELLGQLEDWCSHFTAELPGGAVELVSYPGIFAHGRLDPGTELLARCLPELTGSARVLDFGCGAGVLGLAVRQKCEAAELHLVDDDAVAVHATRRNVPDAHVHLSEGLSGLPRELRFDLVVSNPPFHQGRDRDVTLARGLAEQVAPLLQPNGRLMLVTERTLPVRRWLGAGLCDAELVSERGGYRVWSARAGGGRRGRERKRR